MSRSSTVVLFILSIVSVTAIADEDDSEFLENLKNYDSIYQSGFTVSGTRRGKDEITAGSLWLETERKWRLTFGGERVGYLMEMLNYEKPDYQPPAQPVPTPPGKEPDESLHIPVRTKQWGYWGRVLSGNHYEDTVVRVTAEGEVSEIGKMHNSSLFGPRDDGPAAPRRVALWSMGRFFSSQILSVTNVEENDNGLLSVSATGVKSKGQNGRWEFEIEPDAAWIVRRARFYWDIKPDKVNMEMKNEGTIWSGPYCIPESATINHWGAIEGDDPDIKHVRFNPVVEEFDEELYAETERVVANNEAPTLAIHDYRVSPPAVTEPFRPKPAVTAPPTDSSGRIRWIWILNGILLLLALLVFLIKRVMMSKGD